MAGANKRVSSTASQLGDLGVWTSNHTALDPLKKGWVVQGTGSERPGEGLVEMRTCKFVELSVPAGLPTYTVRSELLRTRKGPCSMFYGNSSGIDPSAATSGATPRDPEAVSLVVFGLAVCAGGSSLD